jgi:hypothetical protein
LSHPDIRISKIFQDNAFTKNLLGLHGMSYYIFFLKSLWRLEEFRKNPHLKIPPKYPCTNFQSLGKFKNSIFIPKRFPLQIWPSRPSRPLAYSAFRPSWPYRPNLAQLLTRPLPLAETSTAIVSVSCRCISTAQDAMAALPPGASPPPPPLLLGHCPPLKLCLNPPW